VPNSLSKEWFSLKMTKTYFTFARSALISSWRDSAGPLAGSVT